MARDWIKEVAVEDLKRGKTYFFAKKFEHNPERPPHYLFYGETNKGKNIWTEKPGIAVHVIADEKFTAALLSDPAHVALEIPKDHAKRWKRWGSRK